MERAKEVRNSPWILYVGERRREAGNWWEASTRLVMFLRWVLGIWDFGISFIIPFDTSDIKITRRLGDGVNQRWARPVRVCLRWKSANWWCIQSALLCDLLQQGRLLWAGSGKEDMQVAMGKRCSYTPGCYSSRIECAGERGTGVWRGKRGREVCKGGGLLEMGNSTTRRTYTNPGRSYCSDVRALGFRKLGNYVQEKIWWTIEVFTPTSPPVVSQSMLDVWWGSF